MTLHGGFVRTAVEPHMDRRRLMIDQCGKEIAQLRQVAVLNIVGVREERWRETDRRRFEEVAPLTSTTRKADIKSDAAAMRNERGSGGHVERDVETARDV